jgi:hypothetical protein
VKPIEAITYAIDQVTTFDKTLLQVFRSFDLVFDNQDAHVFR